MTGKETVELLQQHFPKFTKVALCMVRNPEYGVVLAPKAKQILRAAEGIKPHKRKVNNKLTIRLDDNEMASVKEVMEQTGCKSYRELIEMALEKMGG